MYCEVKKSVRHQTYIYDEDGKSDDVVNVPVRHQTYIYDEDGKSDDST